ncbi:MAG: hypothetical protein ACAI34_05525 [Verrucomicrobium sp.]|nr:hypothetical protein [Verrucomicrobium sp.]
MTQTTQAIKFLFVGPALMVFLALVNKMSFKGVWWCQWPILFLALCWFVSLYYVVRAIIVAGGIAALVTWLKRR